MGRKYRVEQHISISGSECGIEIELKMVVTFIILPGSEATMTNPAEEPEIDFENVRFFDGNDEIKLPWSIEDRITSRDEFKGWLLSEAAAQHQRGLEDAADAKREMMREERNV